MADNINLIDDATRPKGPPLPELTPQQRQPGKHLAMIHEQFRQNMRIIQEMMTYAAEGAISAKELRTAAEAMPMLQNYRQFGNLCGQHCQIITMHHSIEDRMLFPRVSQKAEALRPVIEQLIAEHEIIHTLIDQLTAALETLVETPEKSNYDNAIKAYTNLERVLLSHFKYEEAEIGDALGYYDINV